MVFTVYVLSNPQGRIYIGQTSDLPRRIVEHNTPEHNIRKHTSRIAGPWSLAYSEVFSTRSGAMRRERELKSGQGRQWLSELLGRASPPEAD
ncbi:MAG: GIY-YIG nuclease family protein [Candidatus Brocadiia bacterium]